MAQFSLEHTQGKRKTVSITAWQISIYVHKHYKAMYVFSLNLSQVKGTGRYVQDGRGWGNNNHVRSPSCYLYVNPSTCAMPWLPLNAIGHCSHSFVRWYNEFALCWTGSWLCLFFLSVNWCRIVANSITFLPANELWKSIAEALLDFEPQKVII